MRSNAAISRQEVRALLRELIATTGPGGRLPSERELSIRWNAARMTIRKATDALVEEGLVVRRQGSGTYVQQRPVAAFPGPAATTQDTRTGGPAPGSAGGGVSDGTAAASASAGTRYLRTAASLVERLWSDEWPNIDAAAELITGALAGGGSLHAFGSGHSHMFAEELFYRAGGLVRVRPILFEGLMLHASAPLSTALERLPGLAVAILDDHPTRPGDVLLIASNSGGNAVVTEMAREARARDLRTIAITSINHATSASARLSEGARLHELVDVAVDNGGVVGDAAVEVAGLPVRVAPTSTVVAAAIANALVAEVAERLLARGVQPEVFSSSNVAGGDAVNQAHLRRTEAR